MSAKAGILVIDARPRTSRGLFAGEFVSGKPVLTRIIEAADPSVDHFVIHARLDEHKAIQTLIPESLRPRVRLLVGPPPEGVPLLRTDRLYDAKRLQKALRKAGDPEKAVLWRLDGAAGLEGAADEFARRESYQPIGRFWAFLPARMLAESLKNTPVRPNAVTLAATAHVLLAALLVAFATSHIWISLIAAALLSAGLILDTADGHLARIQGTASAFGRWLDATLDESCDMALHAAIAWSTYRTTLDVTWLVAGMGYAMGKYAFFTATVATDSNIVAATSESQVPTPSSLQSAIRFLGHADVRWHLWIICAALGLLRFELLVFSVYYPSRLALVTARKVVTRGV